MGVDWLAVGVVAAAEFSRELVGMRSGAPGSDVLADWLLTGALVEGPLISWLTREVKKELRTVRAG